MEKKSFLENAFQNSNEGFRIWDHVYLVCLIEYMELHKNLINYTLHKNCSQHPAQAAFQAQGSRSVYCFLRPHSLGEVVQAP